MRKADDWTAARAREQARAHWRRDLLVLFGLLLAIGGAGGAGYWTGWTQGVGAAHATEAGLRAAFSGGHADAAAWLKLMSWNDADAALALCKGPAVNVQGGRKACAVPMWVEPPPKPPQPNG